MLMSTAASWQCTMKQTLKLKNKFKHILKIEFLKSPWSLRKQTKKQRPLPRKKMCSAICFPHFLLWKKGAGIKTQDWILWGEEEGFEKVLGYIITPIVPRIFVWYAQECIFLSV